MFDEDASTTVDCLQSSQAILRDKAKKVSDLLWGGHKDSDALGQGTGFRASAAKPAVADLPDLMNTRDFNCMALMAYKCGNVLGGDGLICLALGKGVSLRMRYN